MFDSVGVWREISDFPYYQRVQPLPRNPDYFTLLNTSQIAITDDSIIYDTSLLLPSQQTDFVNSYLENLWNSRVETKPKFWTLLAFEEFHLCGRNVRTNVAESILRIMTAGRNCKVRCLGIVPDMALLDASYIRLSGQRYRGKLLPEENGKRKFNASMVKIGHE